MGRKQQPIYENVLQQKLQELFEESREKLRTVNDLQVCVVVVVCWRILAYHL